MSSETNNKTTKSLLNRNKGTFKKAIVALFLTSSLTISAGFAKADDQSSVFNKIYHVYNGEEYIGYVSDKKLVDELIENKKQESSAKFKGYALEAGENITVVPEQIFNVEVKDEETLNKLDDIIEVEASAVALTIDGQVVTYLQNEAAYDELMNRVKLQYVSQKELDVIATRPSVEQLPELKENETRIVEVSLEQEVKVEETIVNPLEMKTVDEAFELLKNGTLKPETYTVQQGDVLGAIAKKHNLTTQQLMDLNKGVTENTVLKIGQSLNVTVLKPLVTVKVVKESVKPETVAFTKVTEQDATKLKGESAVKQQGVNGKKTITAVETIVNGQATSHVKTKEVVVTEPVNEVTVVGTKVIPSRGTGSFVWPTNGGYISSPMGPRWGEFHRGIDIARPSNLTIKAADNGVVTAAGWEGTYGYRIVVNHNNGYQTLYAHLSKINVSVGQVVGQGSAIGIMGSTGNSTGTHLHFEVQKNGALVNPTAYLP